MTGKVIEFQDKRRRKQLEHESLQAKLAALGRPLPCKELTEVAEREANALPITSARNTKNKDSD